MDVLILTIDVDFSGSAPAGRARRVAHLAQALARGGADVTVVAGELAGSAPAGLRAIGAPDHPPFVGRDDPLAWVLHLTNGIVEAATGALRDSPADLIHAHDWQSAWAAAAVKGTFGLPLVSTLHGARQADGRDPAGTVARQAAWWLTYESRRTILHDTPTRKAVELAFDLPSGKQDVIGPGRGSWTAVAERTMRCYRRAISEEESSLWRRDVTSLRSLWRRAHP